MSRRNSGSLVLVGIGFLPAGHVTTETLAYIRDSEKFFYLTEDALAGEWLRSLRSDAVGLSSLMREGKLLIDCCNAMVEALLKEVRHGFSVCAAFAGHPGIGVYPVNEAIRQARKLGLTVRLIPAISAIDCLFADLGVDPYRGCQIFAGDQILQNNWYPDSQSSVILLQPAVVGAQRYAEGSRIRRAGLNRLVARLQDFYPSDHEVVIYEAATLPIALPRIDRVLLRSVSQARLSPISTLYIPPSNNSSQQQN